ncbi:protein tyrosine phosphatase, receptor type, B precursor [Corchorus capsularis]|uniref:Protein tyrosine phosphatase, receptor type, B n=1 Tax=Corchorus capsularis TaxID=210143 RepID=A0A1R3K2L4_COCAP|nr:protein tyrosine phosphatase, receptor type, B precursor [Corchorus capsularis]
MAASHMVTDLWDEAIRRDKKKYKKRRAEESPVLINKDDDANQEGEEIGLNSPVPTVPLVSGGVSYRDRVAGSFPAQESNWEWEDWNRFNSLRNVKADFVEKKKETLIGESSVVKNGPFKYDKKEWKPKKDNGIVITTKSSGKWGFKTKSKGIGSPSRSNVDIPKAYSIFEPNKVTGPRPGFYFKAGDLKAVTFDARCLEELVGNNLDGPVVEGLMSIAKTSAAVVFDTFDYGGKYFWCGYGELKG